MKNIIWKYIVLKLFRKEIENVFQNGRNEEQGKMYIINENNFKIKP